MSDSNTYDPHRAIMLVRGTRPDPAFSESNRGRDPSPEGFTLMRATAAQSIFNPPPEGAAWRVPGRYDGDAVGGASAVSGEVLGIVELPAGEAAKALAAVASGKYDSGRGADVREGATFDDMLQSWSALTSVHGAEVRYAVDALVERERVGILEAVSVSVSDLKQVGIRDPSQFSFSGEAEGHSVLLVTKDPEHGRMLSSYALLDGKADLTAELGAVGDYGPIRLNVLDVEPRMAQLMVSRDEATYALSNDADAAKHRARGQVTDTGEALRLLAGAVSQPVRRRDKHGVLRESGRMVGREALQKTFTWESKQKFRSVAVDLSLVSGHLRQMIRPLADKTRTSLKAAVVDSKSRATVSIVDARKEAAKREGSARGM